MQSLRQSLGLLIVLTGFCLCSGRHSTGSLPGPSSGVHGMCDGGAHVETEAAKVLSRSCPFFSLSRESQPAAACVLQASRAGVPEITGLKPVCQLPDRWTQRSWRLAATGSSWPPTSSLPEQLVQASALWWWLDGCVTKQHAL